MGRTLQLGKNLRLIQKTLHAILVIILYPSGQHYAVMVGVPCGQSRGHIFFNRNLDFQRQVVSQIGNSEPADAQHFSNQIPSIQNGSERQRKIRLFIVFIKAAMRA